MRMSIVTSSVEVGLVAVLEEVLDVTHLVVHSDEVLLVHPAVYVLCCTSLLIIKIAFDLALLLTLLLLQCDITFSSATVLTVITSLHCQREPCALLDPIIFPNYS